MSKNNPSTRNRRNRWNLLAFGLLAGVVLVPSAASAAGGHHYSGRHGGHRYSGHHYGGHHRGYSYGGHHGGLHLGLSFGRHGSYSGGYLGYGRHRSYGGYGSRYRSPYYGSYGNYGTSRSYAAASASRYRSRDTTPYVADASRSGRTVAAPWDLLAAGRYADAQLAFGYQASGDAGNSVPKVGYALASALSGDLNKGVWAMRRALQSNPDALEYVTVSQQLRPRIEHLVHGYARHADARFMISALHQLLGVHEGAPAAHSPVTSPVKQVTRSGGTGQHY